MPNHRRLLTLLILGTLAVAVMGQDDSCAAPSETSTVEENGGGGDGGGGGSSEEEAAPAEPVTFGEAEASGDFAIAQADGTIDNPEQIRLLVNATPNQQVSVTYSATCAQGTGAGSSDDQFTASTPVDRTIELPSESPDDCIVAANAQLESGGDVRVRLRGTEGGG